MKPWMKVAIGCFAVSVIAFFLFVAGVVGLGYWAKGKVEEVTGGGPEVEEARRVANATPFTRPARGIIAEPRLVTFIAVRGAIFSVYEKYGAEIESRVAKLKDGKSFDFGDISTGLTLMGELQRAETFALAKHGMSEDEYGFITEEVYKSMWTDFGAGEAGSEAIRAAGEAAARAADAARSAGKEGLPKEAREALAEAASEIAKGTREASKEMEDIKTAPENVVLFKRYEADLKKYAMPGLRMFFGDDGLKNPPFASPSPGSTGRN
jgi:hypothetical protein